MAQDLVFRILPGLHILSRLEMGCEASKTASMTARLEERQSATAALLQDQPLPLPLENVDQKSKLTPSLSEVVDMPLSARREPSNSAVPAFHSHFDAVENS